ncbi:hypothetical protein MANES_01G068901v8 [Manihot esculenta]|uniref:Uncharacterized protein n=1 Tax=Manihot esculenta TaxID=3983 RepID=A0ACB7ICD3_MANES|nr:hypothetical protein MANES_01G068901v8 [Manihot esculenta]
MMAWGCPLYSVVVCTLSVLSISQWVTMRASVTSFISGSSCGWCNRSSPLPSRLGLAHMWALYSALCCLRV